MRKKLARMALAKILELVRRGRYQVNTDTGQVIGCRGKPITPFFRKDDTKKHLYVRLYYYGKAVRSISVAKLVWIAYTNSLPPPKWEVHHRDEDPSHNGWINLLCLHPLDHGKLHRSDVPF